MQGRRHGKPRSLLAVYAAERGHLAKLAGQMVAGKLDEQHSLISEKTVEQLELALTGILRDLGHDPATEYVRQIVGLRQGAAPPAADGLHD